MILKVKKVATIFMLTTPLMLVTACSGDSGNVVNFNTGQEQIEQTQEGNTNEETQIETFEVPTEIGGYANSINIETIEETYSFLVESYQETINKANQVLSYTTSNEEKALLEKIINENTEAQAKAKSILTQISPDYQNTKPYVNIMGNYDQSSDSAENYVQDLINRNVTVILVVSGVFNKPELAEGLSDEGVEFLVNFLPNTRKQNFELNDALESLYGTSNELVEYGEKQWGRD